MSSGGEPGPPVHAPTPTPESVLGHVEFAERVIAMARCARQEVVICSHDLDRRIYGDQTLIDALRKFLLEHRRGRLRGLVSDPRAAMRGAHRMVELSRVLSSRIEFRQPAFDAANAACDFVIVDQRSLLLTPDPGDLEAHYYADAPGLAREQLRDFEQRWQRAEPAREFTDLRL
ncbi:MAG: hypothetical protein JWQ90_1933 [Hydrocarboniphaga sp.]|uniref:DUF7931 domain-containing protein n=1 Tax=Hydrocarboniphaga sp. TaxID=2033016 RepID=UPI002617734F|nr:hypothetical protein [Hydrocarboniphaga sp.]MDB5969483.1 hypothetical protein [Hydrocarboniphaga sp.]